MTLYIWIAVLLLLALVLFLKVELLVSYDDTLHIRMKIGSFRIEPKPAPKQEKPSAEKEEPERAVGRMNGWLDSLKKFRTMMKKFLPYIKKHCCMSDFRLEIEFGTGDAAQTGILSGMLWGIGYGILRVVVSILPVTKHTVRVSPSFNERRFHVRASCIVTTRPVHIMSILCMVAIENRKYEKSKQKEVS